MRIRNRISRLVPLLAGTVVCLAGLWFNSAMAQGHQTKKETVDVNSADVKTLETLPGIGSTLAQRIIDGRPYKNLDDLGKVKGMNKTKVDALKDQVTFGAGGTTAKHKEHKAKKTAGTAESNAPPGTTSAGTKQSGTKPAQTTPPPTGHAEGKLAPGQKINLNTATAEELETLPGIGPTKAQAIIDYRNQNGNFKTTEDIQKVKGIKGGTFSKIKDNIKVTD
jgi:competence protein ComEA